MSLRGAQPRGNPFFMKEGNGFPVAVPDKIIGLTLILDFIDRCHSLNSLYLPQAALASLPHGLLCKPRNDRGE